MAFHSERLYGRTSKMTLALNGRVTREHRVKYRCFSDDQLDTFQCAQQFIAETGITQFARHSTDNYALCRSFDVTEEQNKNPYTYLLDVLWSTETPDPTQQDRENDNPFDDAIEIESDNELVTFPLFKDRDDKLIANSLGDPMTGIEGETGIEIIRFTRNEPRRDGARDRQYRYALNSVTYSGADVGTLKMRSITSRIQYRNQIEFWAYVYEMAYKKDGWQPTILNAGLYQAGIGADDRIPCVDRNNEPVTEPVPLSSSSIQLGRSTLPDSAVFRTFNTQSTIDFAGLGLPA